MEDNRGKGEQKVFTREQKVARMMKKKFRDDKEVIKEIVAIEFEAMGINPDSVLGNEKEMAEWIKKKKSRLREIENSSGIQNKNDERPKEGKPDEKSHQKL